MTSGTLTFPRWFSGSDGDFASRAGSFALVAPEPTLSDDVTQTTDEPTAGGSLVAALRDLDRLRVLGDDYNGYGTAQPNGVAVFHAARITIDLHLAGLVPERVAPSAEGGVALVLFSSNRQRYAAIECFNAGDCGLLLHDLSTGAHEVFEVGGESAAEGTAGMMSTGKALEMMRSWVGA